MTTVLPGKLSEFLGSLHDVREVGSEKWLARCPAHDDHRASLSVRLGDDGRVLVRCHAGCTFNDIVRAVGMKPADFAPPHQSNGAGQRIDTVYNYCDAQGVMRFQVVRFRPKAFRQRRPDGNGGWFWNKQGCPVIPYRLPELLAADPSATVHVAEGEKDVERLRSLGLIATCGASGCGGGWGPEHAKHLAGRHVVVFADNDAPGRTLARQVARSLGAAASVRLIELPGLPDSGDVSDWLDAGNTLDDLRRLVDGTPAWTDEPQPCTATAAVTQGQPRELTDMGNAERFAVLHGDSVRYLFAWDKWLAWNGRRWQLDDSGEIMRRAKLTARSIFAEAADATDRDEQKLITQWAHVSQSRSRLDAMVALARSEQPIPASVESLDANPYLLNCENGTLDLKSGELLPHDPSDMLTKSTGIDYPTEAGDDAVLWQAFLDTVFDGDAELIGFVQRLMGCALVAKQVEHLLPIFHGLGANGKSVFTSTMLAALGEYGMTAPPGLLMVKRGESHPTENADLHGKRLVVIAETRDGQRLDEGMVKATTGNDRIRARRMREDFWEFTPTHLPVLVTNHRPVVRGTDNGIWRRLRLVPFEVTIPEADQDKQLPDKLCEELPQILRWMVQGCLAWQRSGLAEPQKVLAATQTYRTESDLFAQWFDETMEKHPLGECKATPIYKIFCDWCEVAGERPITQTAFGQRIADRILGKRSSNGTWYLGIRPRNS